MTIDLFEYKETRREIVIEFNIYAVEETQEIAKRLATKAQPGMVILLDGPLGSGKTTFTQAFGKALGIQRAIKSPTYTIVKEYDYSTGKMVHIDAYRLEEGGADTIDLAGYLATDAIILIEWSEFLSDYLPENRLRITFVPQENPSERVMQIQSEGNNGERYEQLMTQWEVQ